MSTDVYFDYHSPEGWALYQAAVTADDANSMAMSLWWDHLGVMEGRRAHYDPCRVAYLSNLVARCTYDLWVAFEQRWGGILVSEDVVPVIVNDWRVIYDLTQRPENAGDCGIPDDIATPEEVAADLQAHLGFVLDTRVD